MKCFSLLAIVMLTMGCTHVEISYPEGGYPYPKRVASWDEKQYHYALKDVLPKRDSFNYSYFYLFYLPYDEPNLSLEPQRVETFRLTYQEAFGRHAIITISEKGIIVKKGNAGSKYFYHNDSLLTEVERKHFFLLTQRFPIDVNGKDSIRKGYLLAELEQYPQLLNSYYYKKLYEKSLSSFEVLYPEEKYTYSTSKVPISTEQYKNWVEELNKSGYWKMPYHIEDEMDDATDGTSFTLEANTQEKYNMVEQTSTSYKDSKFLNLCYSLVKLAKVKLN